MRIFLSSVFLILVQFTFAQKDLVQITDMLKIKQPANVTLTKDGRLAAFTLTATEPDGESKVDYKNVTQIYIVQTKGNLTPRQLTSGKENAIQPSWSPDGKRLAFTRVIDLKQQVFVISMEGGEAMQLTKAKYGASNPKWSPDGKNILYSSAISINDLLNDSILNPERTIPTWSAEKPGFNKNEQLRANNAKPDPNGNLEQVRAYLSKNETDNKAKVHTRLTFQNETNVTPEQNFTRYFIIDAEGSDPRSLTTGFYRFNSVDFTPDGKKLIYSGYIDPNANPDRALESQILTSDIDGKNMKVIMGAKGWSYANPRLSPSGKWLAYQYSTVSFVEIPTLAIVAFDGSYDKIIKIPMDRGKANIIWQNDESFYFISQTNGTAPIYKANVNTRNTEKVYDDGGGVLAFDISGDKIAFTTTGIQDPAAMYISDLTFKAPANIGNFNNWIKEKKISVPEKYSFVNNKGMTVEYWVMKPSNFEPGKKYPLLVEMHGGPSVMWGPGEQSMWHEFQYFCSKGYGVVYCNPRGSAGYGTEFLRGNVKDWGAGPASDVLTSLDKTVAEGWADTSKLLITGGSYAGYLTAWIISHDKRFKAACAQRGVYDLPTFFGEGNAWRLVPNYFGGYPWQRAVQEELFAESPINYVENITTPFIIFHGENDRRTGFVQSEMLYRSLKVLERQVEYVRHPDATHEITRTGDSRQRIDQMLRTWEFFERWVR